jgi:hypothetical protein
MESECIIPCSQESSIDPNPEPDEFSYIFSIYLSLCLWIYSPLLDLYRFLNFLIFYTVGRIVRYVHSGRLKHRNKHTDMQASNGIRTHDPII